MINDNVFYKYWYEGFESALKKLDNKNREILLRECGKACSNSYTKNIYIEEFNKTGNIPDFLKNLKNRFSELKYEINEKRNSIIFSYTHCACDLVTNGFIRTGLLCDCSRLSLLDNWEAVIGQGNVEVILKQSILKGQEYCIFEIKVKSSW